MSCERPSVIDITLRGQPLHQPSRTAERADLVWKIYGLESSYGRNDGCKREGRGYNGFGFGWNNGQKPCYPTFDAVVAEVHAWVESMQKQGYNIPTMLCYYNVGKLVKNCGYYQLYLQLN